MSLPDGSGGEIDRGFAMPYSGTRVFNIDLPTSIIRRASPNRGQNSEAGTVWRV